MKIEIYDYSCTTFITSLEPAAVKYNVARNTIPEVSLKFITSDIIKDQQLVAYNYTQSYWATAIGNVMKMKSFTKSTESFDNYEYYIITSVDLDETYCNVKGKSIAYEFRNAYCTKWNTTLWSSETKTLTQMVATLNQACQNPSDNYEITNNRGYIGNVGMEFAIYGTDLTTIKGDFDFKYMQGDSIISSIIDTYGCEVIYDGNKIVFSYEKPVDYYTNTYNIQPNQTTIFSSDLNFNDYSFNTDEKDITACILPTYSLEVNDRENESSTTVNTAVVYNTTLESRYGQTWCNTHTKVQNYSPSINGEWNREIWGVYIGRNGTWAYDTLEFENGYSEDYINVYSWAGKLIGQADWSSPTTQTTFNIKHVDNPSTIIGTVTVTPGTDVAYTFDATIHVEYYGGVMTGTTATTPVWVADKPSDLLNKEVVRPLGQKSTAHFLGAAKIGESTTATRYNCLYVTTDSGSEAIGYACYLYYKQTYSDYSTKLYNEIHTLAQLDINALCNADSVENISGDIVEGIEILFGGDEFKIISSKLLTTFTQYVESFEYDAINDKYSNVQFGYKVPTLQVIGAKALERDKTRHNSQKK